MKTKKIELYKADGYDYVYIDKDGNPYSLTKRKLNKRELPNGYKDYYLQTKEHGKQKNEVYKNIVARTFLGDVDDKFVYHKDGDIENYNPNNLVISSERNEDLYVTCKICGCKTRKPNEASTNKTNICKKCKYELEKLERKLNKEDKRKELYKYFMNNSDYFLMTTHRKKLLEHLKYGRSDKDIAESLGITRQAVNYSIKSIQKSIRKQKFKENNNE